MFKVSEMLEKAMKGFFIIAVAFGFYLTYIIINLYFLTPTTTTEGRGHETLTEEEHYQIGLTSLSIFNYIEPIGLLEPHLSYYNSGTGFLITGYYNDAATLLEISLTKVQKLHHECFIRNNLALSYEKLGDITANNSPTVSQEYYGKAVTTIQEAPPACFPPPPPEGGSEDENENPPQHPQMGEGEAEEFRQNGESMEETEERSQSKSDNLDAEGQTQANKEQLQENLDNTNSNNMNSQDRGEQEENSNKQPADKPW